MEIPPNPELGDYAFPCFRLAKQMRMAPPKIAQLLADKLAGRFPGKVQAGGGYLNFFADRELFAGQVLAAVAEGGEAYGLRTWAGAARCASTTPPSTSPRSSTSATCPPPPSATPCTASTTSRATSAWASTIWATGAPSSAKLIGLLRKWGDRAEVEAKGIDELSRLYVYYHEQVEEHPELEDEGGLGLRRLRTRT